MRALLLVTASLLLTACGPSGQQVIDQRRPEVEARIKQLEEFAAKVASGEASQSDLALPAGIKLKVKLDGKQGNAAEFHLADLQGAKPELEYVHTGSVDLMFARQYLAGQGLEDGGRVASIISDFLQPRFAVVVRETSLTLPIASASGDTFEPGNVDFEVHLLDLQERKELGVVRGTARSSDTAIARTEHYENTNQDLKYSLSLSAGIAYAKLMRPYVN